MITIYSQDGCAPCRMVETYLTKFGKEYEIKKRDKFSQEMLAIAGTLTTPLVTDGSRVSIGYKPMELSEML